MAAADILDEALDSAEPLRLKLLLDLHAASARERPGPTAEGGFRGSGTSSGNTATTPTTRWRRWLGATATLRRCGSELVNDPRTGGVAALALHRTAYRRMAELVRPGTHLVFSDGYLPWFSASTVRGRTDCPVVMDNPPLPVLLPVGLFGFTYHDQFGPGPTAYR